MIDLRQLKTKFAEFYGREPRFFRAPGRVNLIGEHTDYNDGFVLPFAIDREVIMACTVRSDTTINIQALDINDSFSFDLSDAPVRRRGKWVDYMEGTIRCLQKRYDIQRGADLAFSSTVPIGSGLSSSAALEVSTGLSILLLNQIDFDRRELAFAARDAENEFVGVRTGLMDQFASVFGQKDHALLLDCRSLEIRQIPLRLHDTAIIICNTKVKHELASSEYNRRREECEKAVALLRNNMPEIKSLRDVSQADFEKFQDILPEKLKMRARHVITENARTIAAAECLEKSELIEFGRLMYLSHESLRDDYQVSSVELDTLVESARKIEGVYGGRMTGGGFGGCTVNLVEKNALQKFQSTIAAKYEKKFNIKPEFYIVQPSSGASEAEPPA